MKAIVFYAPGDMRYEDRPKPDIGDNDLIIKVKACAICGTDLRIFNSGHHGLKPPQIIGHEISGIIEEKGKNVMDFKLDDRVVVDPIVSCGSCYYCQKGMTNLCLDFKKKTKAFGYYYPGGFAEYMAVPDIAIKRGNLIRVPDSISFEEAAIAEPMGCALNGELLSRTGDGDTVLIIGGGPMGAMHASLAKILGATKIIMSEISDKRLETTRYKKFADYYINPAKEDLRKLLIDITDGIGPNVIIIAAPSGKAQEEAIELAANRAHICFFGGLPKDNNIISIDSNIVHYKELFINGSSGATTNQIKTCIDLMSNNMIDGKKFISKIIKLEDLPAIIPEITEGNYLKVVIKP